MDLDIGYQLRTIKSSDCARLIQRCRMALEQSQKEIKNLRDHILSEVNDEKPEEVIHKLGNYALSRAKIKFYQECITELNDIQSQASQSIDEIQNSALNFKKLVELSKTLYTDNKDYNIEKSKTKSKKKKHSAKGKSKKAEKVDSLDFDIDG